MFTKDLPDWLVIRTVIGTEVELWQMRDIRWLEGNDRRIPHFYYDRRNTLCNDAYLLSGPDGEIDDSSSHVRSTIGHSDDDTLPVGRIGHLQLGTEGVGSMGTGQRVMMQPLATRRLATRELY